MTIAYLAKLLLGCGELHATKNSVMMGRKNLRYNITLSLSHIGAGHGSALKTYRKTSALVNTDMHGCGHLISTHGGEDLF